MELISTDDFYILQPLQKGEDTLWCCKKTAKFSIRPSWDLAGQENPECLGIILALYGKVNIHPDVSERLILVRGCDRVGELPGKAMVPHPVYKVTDVVLLPLEPSTAPSGSLLTQLGLKPCPKHHGGVIDDPEFNNGPGGKVSTDSTSILGKSGFGKLPRIGGSLKSLASDTIKNTAGTMASQVKAPWRNVRTVSKVAERFERRIMDEILKMFNDSDSFYFSLTGDITNSVQRQNASKNGNSTDTASGNFYSRSWRDVDDRFFFNKACVQEIIDLNDSRADAWIVPFIQGYVEIQACPLGFSDADPYDVLPNVMSMSLTPNKNDALEINLPEYFTIAIVSRRSRHRAGTRYKRRGVDVDGHVANYVETEQILLYHHYALAFIQVRGSVPIFWSQPGYKYRPPPKLDRTPAEDEVAFKKHFDKEIEVYDCPVICVNLAERSGREKVISDTYLDNALLYDSPDVHFISFDFHDYCRGMHFENVSILLEALEGPLKEARYCWLDRHGVVCTQRGVFRINCIDCLDRTNVVETAIARTVIETQLTKLGVVPPEKGLPDESKIIFQELWANNGDTLSRQYAGTNALKGDFTRTGERNLSGMMKDGVNSASRYYLNQFKDAYRQATIDIMTGQLMSESLMGVEDDVDLDRPEKESGSSAKDRFGYNPSEEENTVTAERVKNLIEDCKKLLIPDLDSVIGAWGLIDSDPVTGDPNAEDMDVIFILARDSYYVAKYDDEVDKITQYQRVSLTDIDKVEFGILDQPTFQLSFRSSVNKSEYHLRVNYRMPSQQPIVSYNDENSTVTLTPGTPECSGYFHMFKSTNLRFFNNLAVVVRTEEERIESLRNVSESLKLALEIANIENVEFFVGKMDRKKSKIPDLHSNFNEAPAGSTIGVQRTGRSIVNPFARGVAVGSRALSNVTKNISRLNPMSKLRNTSSGALKSEAEKTTSDDSASFKSEDNKESQPDVGIEAIFLQKNPSDSLNIDLHSTSKPPGLSNRQSEFSNFLSPNLDARVRKISKSSEDLIGKSEKWAGELTSGLSASLQKDIHMVATHVEDGAVEAAEVAANVITKEVFSPLAKLTKGFQSVVMPSKTSQTKTDQIEEVPARPPSPIQRPVVDPIMVKIAEANSRTKVIIL